MNRKITKIFSAAATAASTALLASTVATETATAATFLYTGTHAKFREAELFLTVNEWTDVSQIDYQALYSLDWELGVGNSEYILEDWDLWADRDGEGLLEVWVSEQGARGGVLEDLRNSQAASDWRRAKVPEPSSAIALGALALGAVASKLRRRS